GGAERPAGRELGRPDRTRAAGAAAARRRGYAGGRGGGTLELLQSDGAIAHRQRAREAAQAFRTAGTPGTLMKHASQTDLALYGAGDLAPWRRPWIGLHVGRCPECRRQIETYRAGREHIRALSDPLPSGVRWERLSAEMAANIRVGLAAGECVAPRLPKHTIPTGWRVAGVITGFCALLV